MGAIVNKRSENMRHLTRECAGFYYIENKNISFDCNKVHIWKLENGKWGICYDRSMTKGVYDSFKDARRVALNLTEKR